MNRILTLIALTLSLALGATLGAEEVQATLMKALGKGQVVLPGGAPGEYKAGTLLRAGARVITADTGLAMLMLEDGTQVSLGPNSDMGISEMAKTGESRSTVFDLVRGLFKATVTKLTLGSKFEVKTPDAVAAVKGTEFEVHCDKDGTEARVKEGKVWLEDEKRERKVEIEERKAARAERHRDAAAERKPVQTRELNEDEVRRFERWRWLGNRDEHYQPSKEDCHYFNDQARAERRRERFERWVAYGAKGKDVGVDEATWDALRPEERINLVRGKVFNAFKGALGESWDDIVNLREEERQEKWRERLRTVDSRRLANEEARVDLALRKSMIDVKGRRVRFDEFIVRPAANEVRFINYTRRENRTDVMAAWNIYNKNLPLRLWEARGMNNRIWHQDAAPQYWVTESHVVFSNDANDSLAGNTHFYDPVRLANVCGCTRWELPVQWTELRLNVPDIRYPEVGGLRLERYERATSYGLGTVIGAGADASLGALTPLGSARGNNMLAAASVSTSDLKYAATDGRPVSDVGGPVSHVNLSPRDLGYRFGDLVGGFRRTYGDGTTLTLKTWGIDESGQVRNLFEEFRNKPLLDAYLDLAFKTYQELNISSNRFTSAEKDIDVVSQILWWSTITKTSDRL